MPGRFLCLHGHFYQPPRENPWLEEIEVQDSAAPFHDWNERVAAECYGPNAAARLLTAARRITGIADNYEGLSFDFGPTLLPWLTVHAPEIWRRIAAADRESAARHGGHGNAIAQAYNHLILPLAPRRDRLTQIRWGKADFRARFGREPEAMWLPETAVDLETLDLLACEGMRFVLLSPYQAQAIRPEGAAPRDATGGRFDPTLPYRCRLPGGRSITVFFYDGPIARRVAFGDALDSADALLSAVRGGFDPTREHDELLSVAVDGETFGHHRKAGAAVLAAALARLRHDGEEIRLTNFAEFLDAHPPKDEVEIREGTSWSCEHGVERWRSDCGCRGDGPREWRQGWRGPLREALDQLRDALAALFEREGEKLLSDPWAARDAFIDVVLSPDDDHRDAFFAAHACRPLAGPDRVQALRLLEMQRNALLMYTSCGWFFSEISGLETAQNLEYAARAIQLAGEVGAAGIEEPFLAALARAKGNLPETPDGAAVYEKLVRPKIVTLPGIVAHEVLARAVSPERPAVDGGLLRRFRVEILSERRETAGPASLTVGHLRLAALSTLSELDAVYAVLHFGANDFRCSVRPFVDAVDFADLSRELFDTLGAFSLTEVVRALDRRFSGADYGLRSLFLDQRRRVARWLLRDTLARYRDTYRKIHEENRRLVQFLIEMQSPIPPPLKAAAQVTLDAELEDLVEMLAAGDGEIAVVHARLLALFAEIRRLGITLASEPARAEIARLVGARIEAICEHGDRAAARELIELLDLAEDVGLVPDLWQPQNLFWDLLARRPPGAAEGGLLARLGDRLYFDRAAVEARLREAARPAAEAAPAAP